MSRALLRIAEQYGTPAYAYDLDVLRRRLDELLRAYPPERIRYSLKANPAPGLCRTIAERGVQADVSSARELAAALEAGFSPSGICLSGPYKPKSLLDQVAEMGAVALSIDSAGELEQLAKQSHRHRVVLRLKLPDKNGATDGASIQRFGIDIGDLPRCRELLSSFEFVGFHLYSRSQILRPDAVLDNLRRALELTSRAADILGRQPQLINFGAGLGVPYKIDDSPLDFEALAAAMRDVEAALAPAPVVIELGRFIVAEAGWYLTRVVGHQRRGGIDAVVVDGGTHQRSDLCGIGLRAGCAPPAVLADRSGELRTTSVLGCLCLPSDVLAESALLPPLELGDVIAFSNAGAYGPSAAPLDFLGHPRPLEVAFEDDHVTPL